ncbi:Holin-like protein cidB [Wickerhamomyces ciferrii]|uniref:Holin-like protein cidB n=1 Tax=Wickerhamomyces ciferrii (strain ATCC 14091 / BCRC 22168 / CBS 111 / JCM 3599 / NBRC 0793 / NRRL Y-1031 F-60-10) TaxID=1206466 RepID=K0KZZ2_WICCF|nr:Holin-like protein cidB [Wickerhamomyces ciferrii]CCH46924.1 Holin-like protein cidB [Wickerhamomyces ciferrii]
MSRLRTVIGDVYHGVKLGLKLSQKHILDSYLKVPFGILVILGILYGVNEVIILTTINFPSSVACMLLLYIFLISSQKILGDRKTKKIVKFIEIPGGFSLRWINIFFTPAFITLPLSSWISAKEALTIAAVFLFGYFTATVIIAYFTIGLQKILKTTRRSNVERAEELHLMEDDEDDHKESERQLNPSNANSTAILGSSTSPPPNDDRNSSNNSSIRGSIDSINSLNSIEMVDRMKSPLNANPELIVQDIPRGDENSIEEQYRKSLNLSKQASRLSHITTNNNNNNVSDDVDSDEVIKVELQTNKDKHTLEFPSLPSPVAQLKRPNNPGILASFKNRKLFCQRSILEQSNILETDKKLIIAQFLNKNFDFFILGILFIVSLPIYFIKNYPMFLHLSIAVATFIFMLQVPPPKFKKFLHPVLCSVGLSWFWFYIFSLIKNENFLDTLKLYKTSRNYLKLFNHKENNQWPGAGDVFSTLMDVSIVSLSIPMYTYRNDLKRHFWALLPPIFLMSFGCFFIYPPLCYKLGISSERSLGFAGRSITLALGTPFVQALDGSVPLMAVCTVVSGIVGALTGQFIFGKKVLRIREDDYVTRGITLGINCGAIATAQLLTIDPRAAAMSSLTFVLFGTMMVIMASITPLAKLVQNWVELKTS